MRMLLAAIMVCAIISSAGAAVRAVISTVTGVSGTGEATYIDLGIYDVVLPTAGGLDFYLDPQGLLTLEAGQSAPLEDLEGGRIVHTGDARIINNSSHAVKVSVSIRADSDGGGRSGAAASFIGFNTDDETTIGLVEADDDTANNILLYAAPSAVNIVNFDTEFVPADTGYIITTDSRTLEFILPAAQYTVERNPDGGLTSTPIPDSGNGIALRFGGYVNTLANWGDFIAKHSPSTVTVYATYTITEMSADDVNTAEHPSYGRIPDILNLESP